MLKPGFKISLITVVHNAESTINRCIESVIGQDFKNLEYIVIDGASTDDTVQHICKYASQITHFISEPDGGIYEAMNKGIKLATGDVVGILNADDFFADTRVLSAVAEAFSNAVVDVVYGDLDYVNGHGKIIRKWRSGNFSPISFGLGWMPPHPTFYCKRRLFKQFGFYNVEFGTAADYELMIRFLHLNKLKAAYLKKVLVKMQTGGQSNRTLNNRFNAFRNDFKAMKRNGFKVPAITIIMKPLRKIWQYR